MAEGEEINVDSLLAEVEAPVPERAMTGGEAPQPETPAEPPAWDGKSWEFDWNGKKIAPDSQEKARTWMSLGHNYSQRMGELNKTEAQRKADYETKQRAVQDMEQRFSPYQRVDEYARQNPEWWKHTLQAFEQRQQQGNGIDPNLQKALQPIQEKLGQFDQFLTAQQQREAEHIARQEDQALDQQIGSIRKEFPNIDLGAVDPETGETLERRVLQHAQQIGTGSFKAAFWDYLGPKLIEQAKATGRETVAKEAQANAKKGILGKTPAPVKTALKPVNTKLPWNSPEYDGAAILKEMGY